MDNQRDIQISKKKTDKVFTNLHGKYNLDKLFEYKKYRTIINKTIKYAKEYYNKEALAENKNNQQNFGKP